MGSELHEEMGLYSPKEGWSTGINHPVAGTYRAIGLNLQGANPQQAARLKQQLDQTKTKLESAEETQLATLTKHQLVGDLLYGTVFNYFALNDLQDTIAAQSAGILNYRLPSYGTFSTNLKVQYLYGLPRQVEFSGLSMDIDKLKNQRVSKTNNKEEGIAFSQSIGARQSAMEHLVPEQMFSTETEKAQGISTVKALAIASAQGQKIWTISQQNLTTAMSQLMLSAEAENDIRNAVNAGKVVTAHEQRINFNGWVGEGYTVIDPTTGAGGYIIAGGGNGGELVNSDNLLIGSAGLLGASDAATTTGLQGKPWFSTGLLKKFYLGVGSAIVGWLGLIVASYLAITNDSLSVSDKLGQVSMNMLGFALVTFLVEAVMAMPAIPFFAGILISLFIAFAIAVTITYINLIYFSMRKNLSLGYARRVA